MCTHHSVPCLLRKEMSESYSLWLWKLKSAVWGRWFSVHPSSWWELHRMTAVQRQNTLCSPSILSNSFPTPASMWFISFRKGRMIFVVFVCWILPLLSHFFLKFPWFQSLGWWLREQKKCDDNYNEHLFCTYYLPAALGSLLTLFYLIRILSQRYHYFLFYRRGNLIIFCHLVNY